MFIGERLKKVRIEKGLSQEELGEELGVSKSAVSLYENNKRTPKLETIMDLIFIFGQNADYFLGSDVVVEIKDLKTPKFRTLTQEEMDFINELRKETVIYDVLFQNPKRGIEYIKSLIK